MKRFFQFISCCAASTVLLTAAQQQYAYKVPPVNLVDMNRRPLQLADALNFNGPLLLQFIFTTCGTICPVMTASLQGVQNKLGPNAAAVRMVSISIDPEHDTPERLLAYARQMKAGPQWIFLTGTEAASIAAQTAFDVYQGNKMRHRPVTFLRPAAAKDWLRFEGLVTSAQLLAELSSQGMRVYREGTSAASNQSGPNAACANCHRKSGMGSTEGGILVPPITAEALFETSQPRPADTFSKLFEQALPAPLHARISSAGFRPAYTVQSLTHLLRTGLDPTGRELDQAMPRYQFNEEQAAQLIGYLQTLTATNAPGVDQQKIHFATVVSNGADPAAAQSMLAVMDAWVQRRNLETANGLSKQGRTAWYREDFYRAFRHWELHVWKLEGESAAWPAQLAAFRQQQPVFAIIGGMVEGPWKPVADFCEQTTTPCLFPQTLLPAESSQTIYFSKGLIGEAEALAAHLNSRGIAAVTQIYRLAEPAQAFRAAFRGKIVEHHLAPQDKPSPQFWQGLTQKQPLILWLNQADYQSLEATATEVPVYTSANLTASLRLANAFLTWPWSLPSEPKQDASRVRGWLLSRRVPKGIERVQFNTWYTLALLDYSLAHMVENFSQDYLLETIENEAETALNPGIFPRLSLGPSQRFASKGAYIVNAKTGKPASQWIVP